MICINKVHLTYGSTIKIIHQQTKQYLGTNDEHYYGGSGQNIAYCSNDAQIWRIKTSHQESEYNQHIGEEVKVGDVVRFENIQSKRNLHSHGNDAPLHKISVQEWDDRIMFRSPITRQQEVTTGGECGHWDINDNWIIMEQNEKTQALKFKHWHTGLFLHSHNKQLKQGKNEVTCFFERDDSDYFTLEIVALDNSKQDREQKMFEKDAKIIQLTEQLADARNEIEKLKTENHRLKELARAGFGNDQ